MAAASVEPMPPPPPLPPPPPPLPSLTLGDLPDEVLDLITAAAVPAGGYAGLFSASRRLNTIGRASVTALTVRLPGGLRAPTADAADVIYRLVVVDENPFGAVDALVDVCPAFFDAVRRGRRFLRRAPRLRAVTLCGGDRGGSRQGAVGMAVLYGAMLMPAVRELRLDTFSASAAVVGALGRAPLTAAALRSLHLRDIPTRAWALVVAPLLAHHGGTLRELSLGGAAPMGLPHGTAVATALAAPDGGMPALRALTLTHIVFAAPDAAAVAAACPALTGLSVGGAVGAHAAAALDADALPGLARLSWIPAAAASLGDDLTPLFAGRSLDAATVGRRAVAWATPRISSPLLSALTAAAALPVELDLRTAGACSAAALRQLVGASASVARVQRLRVALDRDAIEAGGLPALGRLPALTALSILVTRGQPDFAAFPVGGLTHLGVSPWPGDRPRLPIVGLLHALASSPSASTLRSLDLAGGPLDEAGPAAELLGRLSRLRRLSYAVLTPADVLTWTAADAAVATATMVGWMRERLSRVAVVVTPPLHWAG